MTSFIEKEDCVQATVNRHQGPVTLTVWLEGWSVEDATRAGHFTIDNLESWLEQARTELVASVLPLVNGGYLGPDEAPLTSEQFLDRLRLSGIVTDVEGNAAFHFSDDDMLWGHRIQVARDARTARWTATTLG